MRKEPANKDRFLIEALREIAADRGIQFTPFSHDWVVQLNRGGKTHAVYGYNFDLNPAAAASIANDKSAVAAILEAHRIPHVEHVLFLAPHLTDYLGTAGNWSRAIQYAESRGFPIVCKTNQGTRGNSVFKINDQTGLEAAFQKVHASDRGLSLSPFYSIEAEYRTILLQDNELLCYRKERPYVIGDGDSTFLELVQAQGSSELEVIEAALSDPCLPLFEVPGEGQKIPIVWKHNLSKGSVPNFDLAKKTREDVATLSKAACSAIGMQFAAVDVIEADGELKVIEINAGICMEHLSRFSKKGRELAFDVYAQAIDVMFGLNVKD